MIGTATPQQSAQENVQLLLGHPSEQGNNMKKTDQRARIIDPDSALVVSKPLLQMLGLRQVSFIATMRVAGMR